MPVYQMDIVIDKCANGTGNIIIIFVEIVINYKFIILI